jgi:hypothetical protein
MNVHKNARLTPQGRALLVHRVRSDGWRVGDAEAASGESANGASDGIALVVFWRLRCKLALRDLPGMSSSHLI